MSSLKRVLPASFNHEIIVVDICTSPETRNVVKEFERVKILPFKENTGYTRGVNEGLKAAAGDFMMILNPDVVPMPRAIEDLVNRIASNPQIGLIGPQLLNFDGSPQDSAYRFYTPMIVLYRRSFLGRTPWGKKAISRFLMKDKDLTKTCEADWLMGSAYVTSRKALAKVGPMDERFFMYMSDVDWARRFWENGFKVVYYPSAKMFHYHRRESKGRFGLLDIFFRKTSNYHFRDAMKYFKKYGFINK